MNKLFNFCQECNVEDFDVLKDLVVSKMEENYGQFGVDYVIANDNHLRTKKGDQMSFFYKCHWFVSLIIFEDKKEEIYLDEEFLKDILTDKCKEKSINNKVPFPELNVINKEKKPYDNFNNCYYDKVIYASVPYENAPHIFDKAKEISANNTFLDKQYMYDFHSYNILASLTRNNDITPLEELKNYTLGLNGECGELTDIVKKWLYHGKKINKADVLFELGDVLFYLTNIAALFGFSLEDVAINNNIKLLNRYKNGFNIKDSNNRIEDSITNK